MKVTMTQKTKRGRATGTRSHDRLVREPTVTITLKGYTGPGWELSVTGRKSWAQRMVKKWVPEIQRITKAL